MICSKKKVHSKPSQECRICINEQLSNIFVPFFQDNMAPKGLKMVPRFFWITIIFDGLQNPQECFAEIVYTQFPIVYTLITIGYTQLPIGYTQLSEDLRSFQYGLRLRQIRLSQARRGYVSFLAKFGKKCRNLKKKNSPSLSWGFCSHS